MFSDLSGYSALSENMDPEEVKSLMGRIFSASGRIIEKYGGTVDRFFGDEIMALFGVPLVHEEDPVRAIKAALEIHIEVQSISQEYEFKIGRALRMHSGINTGLVVTGDEYIGKGRHGLTGDTINLAKRLTSLAGENEIFIGPVTHEQVAGYFSFEKKKSTIVKGKEEPVNVYKVIAVMDQPDTVHRTQGVRSDLIGRKQEMATLVKFAEHLKQGQGGVVSIIGEAGTGKSRLTREYKTAIESYQVQWHEGHGYGYTQNTPYFLFADMLTHAFQIKDSDTSAQTKQKLESNISSLLGPGNKVTPYIGGLFSLEYDEAKDISPEFWKSRLYKSIYQILDALIDQGPTIICFEDLHWADPSTLDLLQRLLLDFTDSVLFICAYRPYLEHFPNNDNDQIRNYQEIHLGNLDQSDSNTMLSSLLKTESVPPELAGFVHSKAEGNPFYLEEVINSLIESKIISQSNNSWHLVRPITDADIPSSIHGVLSARIDRLEGDVKRIVQEASVIGRAFLYKILSQITDIRESIDKHLSNLELIDLIRTRSVSPDLEYIFKHALTQDVVYSGLLKEERQSIHEKIGLAIETLFPDRLADFFEVLAYHFSKGRSELKAIHYLMKAGKKSLKKFALEESHDYYQMAYDFLSNKADKKPEEKELLILILIDWALVYYYRGLFGPLSELLINNEPIASGIKDKYTKGMFYAWMGFTLDNRLKGKKAYDYLQDSLRIGEDIKNETLIGYACTWLTWSCMSLCKYDDALKYGERAVSISLKTGSEPYLYFKSLAGIGVTYYFQGKSRKAIETGKEILRYGLDQSNIRSQAIGHYTIGYGYCAGGEFDKSIAKSEEAIQVAQDPFYSVIPHTVIGLCHLLDNQFSLAKEHFNKVSAFDDKRGFELMGLPAKAALCVIQITEGKMAYGLDRLIKIQDTCLERGNKTFWLVIELIIGQIYLEMIAGPKPSIGILFRNVGFLLKNVPIAAKRAEFHLNNTVETAKEIGSLGFMGQAYFSLGRLYKAKKRIESAKEQFLNALRVFKECEANGYVRQTTKEIELINEN